MAALVFLCLGVTCLGAAEPAAPPERSLSRAGFEALKANSQRALAASLRETYGFDLDTVQEKQQLELLQRGKAMYAVPDQFLIHFADFPCIAIGMLIGEWHAETFTPSHELVARFSRQFTQQRFTLSPEQVKAWWNGGDLRGVEVPYPTGSIVLIEDEKRRYLGRGKVLRERVRNLLPNR